MYLLIYTYSHKLKLYEHYCDYTYMYISFRLELGQLAAYVTEPVLAGFLNAFAIFLTKAQIKMFMSNGVLLPPIQLYPSIITSLISFLSIMVFPRISTAIPASVVCILMLYTCIYDIKLATHICTLCLCYIYSISMFASIRSV